jgi:hypothetical protein
MKKFSEQLHKKSQSVKLKAAERRDLRERVVSYMEYHPLPNAATEKKASAVASPYFTESFIRIPFAQLLKGGAVVAALVLVIIPALAERAVPGDGLYAIKVSFNEEVRSTLALSPYQKIEWETERLNRRIAEARLLASEGRLTDEVEAEVAEAVRTHTENAKREIEVLRSEDEEEATLASIELNTTLEVQAASLNDRAAESAAGEGRSTQLLATAVKEAAAEEVVENPAVPSYERLMARVETNTTRVQELLASLDLDESSADYQDITRRITDINRTVAEAIDTRADSDESARLLLVDALQRTQRLIVFMTEIQASQEFEVEDFVPVVLTPDEQASRIEEFIATTESETERIESFVSSTTEPAIAEKMSAGITTLRELEERLVQSEVFTESQAIFTEIVALAEDLTKLTDITENTGNEPEIEEPVVAPEVVEATTTEESEESEGEENEEAEIEPELSDSVSDTTTTTDSAIAT